ncbi:Metallo-beta-lactamase [Phytophthora cactorum]|nr:Metallo-beta-lactamase [Phytophthora cactorum]
MLKFILISGRRGFDSSSCWPRLDFAEIRESVAEIAAEEPGDLSSKKLDEDLVDGRITFLGTGCAIPSKYRNGSLGQMYRYVGGDKRRLQELVDRLKCVWISHNHADHHLGLLRLLSSRVSTMEPLLVIGPTPLQFWLDEYSAQDPTVRGKYSFVENYRFDESDSRSEEVESHAETARVRALATRDAEYLAARVRPVKHALQSYAVVLTFVDGAKLAFSGDCRPSDKLAEKAKDAFLIVHEATAKDKAHCTMAEAIQVGRQANARHLLLTHFSQRYPKMAVMSSTSEDIESSMAPQLMDVCAQLMTQDDEDDDAAAASLKAQQEREERKKLKSIERGEE